MQPPPPDPLVVDWLLSSLSRRLYFAGEAGVLACLEYPPERCAEFVEAHVGRPVRALAEVLRLAAAEAAVAAAAAPLEGVVVWTERLVSSMCALVSFRSLARHQRDDAAARFTEAWEELRRCIAELAAALGVGISYLRDMPPEREQGVRRVLDGLCMEMLTDGGPPTPRPSG